MPARPRGSTRASARRIPSTIRKMDSRSKVKTPPPPRLSSRIHTNPPRRKGRTSPRSPRKPTSSSRSPLKRRISMSPKRGGGNGGPRKGREESRLPPKRPRESPPKPRKSPEKKYMEKPMYEGPGEKFVYNREELKKITMRIYRNISGDEKQEINRPVVHPEEITIVRRPGEGATPIFDRQELIENSRKYDEFDVGPSHSDRLQFEPSTSYQGPNDFRMRDYYPEKDDRRMGNSRPSPRNYDFKPRDDRLRDDVQFQPSTSLTRSRSFERLRDHPLERKDHYDDREPQRIMPRRSIDRDREPRRSLDRGGSIRNLDRDRGAPLRNLERERGPPGRVDRDRGGPRRSLDRDRGAPRRSLERGRGMSGRSLERDRGMPGRNLDRNRGMPGRNLERDRGMPRRSLERDRLPRRSLERDRMPRRSLERDRNPRRSLDRGMRSMDRDRGRSVDRLMRRQPSPNDSRRHLNEQYRDYDDRRGRSVERRDIDGSFRDRRDYPNDDRFSGTDHVNKDRSYFEADGRDRTSPPRGHGSGFYPRGRGGGSTPVRPFPVNMGYVARPVPPFRAVRGMPRGPIARRLPFPPRKSFRGSMQGRR